MAYLSHSGAPKLLVSMLYYCLRIDNTSVGTRSRQCHTVCASASEKQGLCVPFPLSLEFCESKIGKLVLPPNSKNVIGLDISVPPVRSGLETKVNACSGCYLPSITLPVPSPVIILQVMYSFQCPGDTE